MVIGASLFRLKLAIFCGTLSSSTRKLVLGMLGMNLPLLSSTATSSSTVFTSLLKVGVSAGISFPFLLNLDGIFGSSTDGSSSLGVVLGAAAGGGLLGVVSAG